MNEDFWRSDFSGSDFVNLIGKRIISSVLSACICCGLFHGLKVDCFAEMPDCSAKSAILIEAETGTVLYAKDMHTKRAMASTTKIMTAVLTIEAGDPDREFVVDPLAIMVEGTTMGLREGDRVSRRDLLYGIILPSGNDAANAAAVSVAGSIPEFVQMMNDKAAELGLSDTHFVTPSGLDAQGHYTSAYDLAMLTAYAMKNELFREIAATKSMELEYGNPPYKRTLYNSNKMLTRYDGAIGVKPGFTDNARRCLVSAAERDGTTLIAVTLNDSDDYNDHAAMLDYGFTKVKSYPLDTSYSKEVAVAGTGKSVMVYAEETSLSLTDEQRRKLCRTVMLPRFLYGNIEKGQKVGELLYSINGKVVKTVPLLAGESVNEADSEQSIWQKALKFIGIYA